MGRTVTLSSRPRSRLWVWRCARRWRRRARVQHEGDREGGRVLMLSRRVIVCLDVRDGRVVKGVRFESLRAIGDPASSPRNIDGRRRRDHVLDINASAESGDDARGGAPYGGASLIPLTVGGGFAAPTTSATHARGRRQGHDQHCGGRAAGCLTEAADRFGAQCLVPASMRGGRDRAGWCGPRRRAQRRSMRSSGRRKCAARGAGEILLTSIDPRRSAAVVTISP